MSVFAVDDAKCTRCGICIQECPPRIIEMLDPKALPTIIPDQAERCITCGHCVAVCPFAAVGLKAMTSEDCETMSKELLPTAEQVEYLLKSRRSIRVYKEKPVPHAVLAKLIDIAHYAPSGHNAQSVQWLIVEDSAEVKKLAELVIQWMSLLVKKSPRLVEQFHFDIFVNGWERGEDRVLRSAPHLIVAHAPKDTALAQENSAIALTYLELAAYSQGLGTCWAGYFMAAASSFPALINELGLPGGHKCFGAMMVGYPKHEFKRIPLRNEPSIIWH